MTQGETPWKPRPPVEALEIIDRIAANYFHGVQLVHRSAPPGVKCLQQSQEGS